MARAWFSNDPRIRLDNGIIGIPEHFSNINGVFFVGDNLFPMHLLDGFEDFLVDGILANGQQTQQPDRLLPPSDARLFSKEYSEWAPEQVRANIPTESPMELCAFILSSIRENTPYRWRVDHQTAFMKDRLMCGLAPMSDRRWCQKRLHSPENFDQACQHLRAVIDAFEYLNMDHFTLNAAQRYNRLRTRIRGFEVILNQKRVGEGREPVGIISLWDEFILTHLYTVSEKAHAWVVKKATELKETQLQRMLELNQGGITILPNNMQRDNNRKILDLNWIIERADVMCMVLTFRWETNWQSPDPRTPPPGAPVTVQGPWGPFRPIPRVPELETFTNRGIVYRDRYIYLRNQELHANPHRYSLPPNSNGAGPIMVAANRMFAACMTQSRLELRGPAQNPTPERWIAQTKRRLDSGLMHSGVWGFAGYRISHKHSQTEWERFEELFQADVQGWDDDGSGLKNSLHMRWLDGRELGIPEGDVEAARRHFVQSQATPQNWLVGLDTAHILIVDDACIESYIHPNPMILNPSDTGGFVRLSYALENVTNRTWAYNDYNGAGFDGTIRVLGSILYEDVWAGLSTYSFTVTDLWMLAIYHPLQIYIGPLSRRQRLAFQITNWLRNQTIRAALDWQRQGSGGAN